MPWPTVERSCHENGMGLSSLSRGRRRLHGRGHPPSLRRRPGGRRPAGHPSGRVLALVGARRVVRVKKTGCLEANGLYPKPDDAKAMLAARLQELTGKADLVEAVKLFVHPQDKVCVKVNGIALQNMATNKELVLPFVEAMIAAGVPPTNITLLEQYPGFLPARASTPKNVPAGVEHQRATRTTTPRWTGATSPARGATTKFVARRSPRRPRSSTSRSSRTTRSSGYTGALKNMTHGCNVNPQDFHEHHASPQIAHPRGAGRPALAPSPLHHRRLQADGPRRPAVEAAAVRRPARGGLRVDGPRGARHARLGRGREGARRLRPEVADGRGPRAGLHPLRPSNLGVGVADPKKITLRDVTL